LATVEHWDENGKRGTYPAKYPVEEQSGVVIIKIGSFVYLLIVEKFEDATIEKEKEQS